MGHSMIYEFAFNAVVEGSESDPGDDTVFNTEYVRSKLPNRTSVFGSGRPIGDGVYLVAFGKQLQDIVVDTSNASHAYPYPIGEDGVPPGAMYDAFLFVRANGSGVR